MLGHHSPQAPASGASSCASTSTCSSSDFVASSKMFRSLEDLADFCAFVVHKLFEPSESSSKPSQGSSQVPPLASFVRYALYRTRLNDQIAFHALFLLHRLKSRYPSARGTNSSPHRLFLAALMLASKILMDDTYSNKSWAVVGQSMFSLREINCMERELFAYLDFVLVVKRERLDAFVAHWAYEWAMRSPLSSPSPSPASPMSPPHSVSPSTSHAPSGFSVGVKRRLSVSASATPGEERHRDKMAALAAHSLLRPSSHPLSSQSLAQTTQRRPPVSRPRPKARVSHHESSTSSRCPSPYFQQTDCSSSSSSEISTPVIDFASPSGPTVAMDIDMPCNEVEAAQYLHEKAIKDLYRSSYAQPHWASPT